MSEAIRKFKPSAITASDLKKGVRFVEAEPVVDMLKQELNVGDIVYYRTSGCIGKVIGIYSRIYPIAGGTTSVKTLVSFLYQYYGDSLHRQSAYGNDFIKLTPEQYGKVVKQKLLDA